jgi:hypothetical protein
MTRIRTMPLAMAIALVIAVGAGATVTATSVAGSDDGAANQLAGTWVVTIHRPAPLPALTSLQVFTSDGSQIEMANEWQSTRTAQYGSWARVTGRTYAATGVFFRFDPSNGAYVSKQVINRTIELSADGQSFVGTARATIYDAAGNVIATVPASQSGERLQVEPNP